MTIPPYLSLVVRNERRISCTQVQKTPRKNRGRLSFHSGGRAAPIYVNGNAVRHLISLRPLAPSSLGVNHFSSSASAALPSRAPRETIIFLVHRTLYLVPLSPHPETFPQKKLPQKKQLFLCSSKHSIAIGACRIPGNTKTT
jgi:hypothetical protein